MHWMEQAGDDNMTEMQCDGCGLGFNATVLRPTGGLPPQRNVENVDINEYARTCRLAKERGRAPAVLLDCPYLSQTIDAAMAAGRL
jgi:rubredoxin